MIDVLLLGATGRTGTALLRHRPRNARLHLGVRIRGGTRPSSVPDGDDVRAIDLTDPVLMRAALSGIDVVVNAIRLPGEIPATALIDLHERIATARDERREEREGPLIIHVGGAGSLHLGDGRRFWQDPAFPAVTLPRGVAHAALRDHLESGGGREVRATGRTSFHRPATSPRADSQAPTAGLHRPTTNEHSCDPRSAMRTSPSPLPTRSTSTGAELI